jgi:hypothetical protein
MVYLASKLWIWLLISGLTGFMVAWFTCSRREDDDR